MGNFSLGAVVEKVNEPNYIAHYINADTGEYMYSIPYYWPKEMGIHSQMYPYNKNMKYVTLEEYNRKNGIT